MNLPDDGSFTSSSSSFLLNLDEQKLKCHHVYEEKMNLNVHRSEEERPAENEQAVHDREDIHSGKKTQNFKH